MAAAKPGFFESPEAFRRWLGQHHGNAKELPRKARSIWSNVNMRRVAELVKAGLMAPARLAAFKLRGPKRAGVYSFEAKREETRARRLATLIADSANGKRLDIVTKYQPAIRAGR